MPYLYLYKILPMSLADIDQVASGSEFPSYVEHSVFSGYGKDVVKEKKTTAYKKGRPNNQRMKRWQTMGLIKTWRQELNPSSNILFLQFYNHMLCPDLKDNKNYNIKKYVAVC